MNKTIKSLVTGRVQGVGFRYFVQKNALKLGLSGSATNLPNGQVEVIVSGEEDKLMQLKQAIEKGPALAAVKSVSWDLIENPVSEGFVIR